MFVPASNPELGVERSEGRALFVFREAEADLTGIAEGRAVDLPGTSAADVANHELERPADRAVRAVALTEDVLARVHPDRVPDRPVHDDHGPGRHRRREQPVDVERVRSCRLDRGDHDGQVLGLQPAMTALIATFSTVHGARSGGTVATTSSGARVVPSSMRSTRASVGGTIGSPSVQPRSKKASCSSSRAAIPTRRAFRRESCWKRIASSGARDGSTESEPQPGRSSGSPGPRSVVRQRLPPASMPAERALDLDAVLDACEGRDRLDPVVPGDGEIGVVDARGAPSEGGVVLGVDRERSLLGERGEDGRDQLAGRTGGASRTRRFRRAAAASRARTIRRRGSAWPQDTRIPERRSDPRVSWLLASRTRHGAPCP